MLSGFDKRDFSSIMAFDYLMAAQSPDQKKGVFVLPQLNQGISDAINLKPTKAVSTND